MFQWRSLSKRQMLRVSAMRIIASVAVLVAASGGAAPGTAQQRTPNARPAGSVDAGGVTLRYPEGMAEQMVTMAAKRTREAVTLLREQVGWTLGPGTSVHLSEHRPPAADTAADDGKIVRLAVTDASVPLLLRGLARSALVARTGGRAPGWLRDGLADYTLERAGYQGRQARIDLLRPVGHVPFADLLRLRDRGSMADPRYERAVATVQLLAGYLEQRSGAGAVTALMDGLDRDQDGLAALEEDFRAWMAREAAADPRPITPPDPTPWMVSYSHPAPPVRTQYKLAVNLDPDTFRLTAQQQVRITNNEAVPLDSLYFHLVPNAPFFEGGNRAGALTVSSVRADGQPVPVPAGKHEILGVRLPAPLAPGAAVTLDLTWEATVPDMAARYGVVDGSLLLGQFYPTLAVHDAGGWHLDRYLNFGDPFYSEVADYDVTFTVPDGVQVAATGHPDAAGRRFTAANVRDFGAAASAHWQLAEQTVDGVHVRFYWTTQGESMVTPEAGLATAVRSLQFFSEQFGPYPYHDLTVVNQYGMEYPQFVFASLPAEIAHEIGHQWWYGVVGNDELRQIWDEGLTQWAMFRYLVAAGEPLGHVWAAGPSAMDQTLYDYSTRPLEAGHYALTIYFKGWRMWESLRTHMGNAAFTEMVRAFYAGHQYEIATWADWRDAVSAAGGPTAVSIFEEYVYGDQMPANLPGTVAP